MDISEAKIKDCKEQNVYKQYIGVECLSPMVIGVMRKKKMAQEPVHHSMIVIIEKKC